MWKISLPLRVPVSKNKQFSLNLNQFRNTHFQALNKAKTYFEREIRRKLRGIPRLPACTLEYVVYAPSRQLYDTNNICSVVDKFFSDTLVSAGVLEDDNCTIVVGSHFRPGGIDRANPRVEVIIRVPEEHVADPIPEPKERSSIMQIKTRTIVVLAASDVRQAVANYLEANGVKATGSEIQFTGMSPTDTFEVIVESSGTTPTVSAPPKETKPRAIKEAKPASESAQPPVEEAPSAEAKAETKTEVKEEKQPAPAGGAKPSLFANYKKP